MTNGQSARGVDTVGGEQQQPPLLQQRLLVASEQTSTPQTVGVGSRASKKRDEPVDRLLLLGCYTSFASMYMLVSFVAPFFPANADRWHLSHMQVGWICSCDAIGEVLSTAFATLVMAKMGCARAAVAGQIGNGISSLIFGLIPLVTQNETALFLGFTVMRLLNGAMTNITFIAVMAVLCNLMPDKIGQVAANIAVLSTIGLTLGPPFGGILTALGGSIVDGMNLERENGRNWQFATPFIGCTVLLLLPTFVLWKARHTIDAAEELDSGEEEVEVSFSEEWRRMKSIINKPVMAAVLATVVTSIGQDARDPILGPHLASRCADSEVIPGEHFPFDYTPLQISLVFSSTCLTFLPLSTYIGAQADIKGRDFAWLRRVMALGLGLEAVAFLLMGPSSMLPTKLIREMETDSCVVLSQMVLGMSNALTLIAAFPFIEGVCELTATTQLTQTQRMAVAGTWYNAAFSLGCALGPLTTGAMSDFVRFSDCVQVLSVISLIAMVCVYLEGVGNTGKVGGFWENPHELNATVWKAIGDKFDAEELEPQRRKKQERREHPLPASFSESGFDVEGMTMRESEILMGVIEPSFTELSSFSGSRMARVAARARGAIPLASTRDQMPEGNSRRYESPGMRRSCGSGSGSDSGARLSHHAERTMSQPPAALDTFGDATDNDATALSSIYDYPQHSESDTSADSSLETSEVEELPGWYSYLIYFVVLALVVTVIAAFVQGDKEPCRAFYDESDPTIGCRNTNTIGLFTDEWHQTNCHALYNGTHPDADPDLVYFPHPPSNPTGCVLVRVYRKIKCDAGLDSHTACLC